MTHMELGLQEIKTRPTSDEIQAALDAIDSCITSYDCGELDGWELSLVKRKVAALQSALDNAETVDLEKLREELAMKLSTLIPHSYSDAVFYNIFDYIARNCNITRKTK